MLALDSEYDYDPVWAKCVELKIAPTFHSASRGLGFRQSHSNFTYNHIGHFATAGEGGKEYNSWLPVVNIKAATFSQENPLRSTRPAP